MAGRRRSVLDTTGVGRLGVGHRGVLEVNRFGPRGRGTPSPRITAAADLRRLVTTGRSPVGLSPTPAGGPPPPVRRVCRVDPSPESWREPAAANTNPRESSCSATRAWPDRQMACVLLPLGFRPLDSLTRAWTANETRPRKELQSVGSPDLGGSDDRRVLASYAVDGEPRSIATGSAPARPAGITAVSRTPYGDGLPPNVVVGSLTLTRFARHPGAWSAQSQALSPG